MKRLQTLLLPGLLCMMGYNQKAMANGWTTNLDIYSSYVFRGTKFGTGPAFQPSIEFSSGIFSIGAWGSYNASTDEAAEADLYTSFEIPVSNNIGLNLTVTDYYFPGTSWFEKESHYIEPMATFNIGNLSIAGAYLMNSGEGDLYLEAGYSFNNINVLIGGGDGAYTIDRNFEICNISVGTSKNIPLTDSYSLPVSGAVILNPSSEQFHIVVGISL